MAETKTSSSAKPKNGGAQKSTSPRPRRSAKSRAVEKHARSYFDAVAARDLDGMVAHWDPNGVDDLVPIAVFRGPDEIRAGFDELFTAVPDLEMQATRVVADDRTAVVEWRMRGHFTGAPFQGLEATGRALDIRGVDLVEIEDDRIVHNTAYFDGAEFARQVGMLPPQDSGAEKAMRGAFNSVTKLRRAWNERTR